MDFESKHPLSSPLLALLERLTVLYGVLNLLENQLDNHKSMFGQSLEDQGIK